MIKLEFVLQILINIKPENKIDKYIEFKMNLSVIKTPMLPNKKEGDTKEQ